MKVYRLKEPVVIKKEKTEKDVKLDKIINMHRKRLVVEEASAGISTIKKSLKKKVNIMKASQLKIDMFNADGKLEDMQVYETAPNLNDIDQQPSIAYDSYGNALSIDRVVTEKLPEIDGTHVGYNPKLRSQSSSKFLAVDKSQMEISFQERQDRSLRK